MAIQGVPMYGKDRIGKAHSVSHDCHCDPLKNHRISFQYSALFLPSPQHMDKKGFNGSSMRNAYLIGLQRRRTQGLRVVR